MSEVVGVSFRPAGKLHLFLCGDLDVSVGDFVVAETKRGVELGRVSKERHRINGKERDGGPRKLVRVATQEDLGKDKANEQRALDALEICARKIKEHGLPMRLIDAEYTLDGSRITFYFTAEARVDFRRLLRDLYASFKTRIQLLQVGVRDEAKMLGGIGPCGRQLCCCSFLRSFDPVAIKMAKVQGLSLNPSKISGVCGRLMCCLRYENEWYGAARTTLPRVGCSVQCEQGIGKVTAVNVLKRTVMVRVEGASAIEVQASEATEVDAAQAEQALAEKETARQAPTEPAKPPAARARQPTRPRRASRAAPQRTSEQAGAPPAQSSTRPRRRQRPRSRRGRRRGPRTQFRSKKRGTDQQPNAS